MVIGGSTVSNLIRFLSLFSGRCYLRSLPVIPDRLLRSWSVLHTGYLYAVPCTGSNAA